MTIPYITPKQQKIPKLIYKFRFLNRPQIQKFLNHKDRGRINVWLNDLCEKEYLEKLPNGSTFEQRTKPAVYGIGINGIRFLKTRDGFDEKIIARLYKDKNRSGNFIDQCVLLAGISVFLQNKTDNKDGISYETVMYADYANAASPFHFLTDLNPDICYKEVKKYKKGTGSRYFLVEIFEIILLRFSVNKRIRDYFEFYLSGEWEDNTGKPFPVLKFICPGKSDLISVRRYTKKLLEENQNPDGLYIQFLTVDEVKKSGITYDCRYKI